ncbi:MAG: pro-sigmaK processing inhibitor BofA family protein [Faecalibacterium sp.]|nr:pro-sigmaK processing inhibitor BofA family protein [Faecalibacterium sp.]
MFKGWAASAAAGLAALGALQLLGPWLGFALSLNTVSLATAAALGLPGIVGLLLCRVLFLAG